MQGNSNHLRFVVVVVVVLLVALLVLLRIERSTRRFASLSSQGPTSLMFDSLSMLWLMLWLMLLLWLILIQ
jgi:hypothetical protein